MAMAVGAAISGMRPVVELMYSDFITLAMDPLVNQAAKLRYMFGGQVDVPMVVRTNLGASGGKAAQHSQSPGELVRAHAGPPSGRPVHPGRRQGPAQDRDPRRQPGPLPRAQVRSTSRRARAGGRRLLVPFGEARVWREGSDATVVATHAMLHHALAVAESLAAEGIELEVIDPRTLVPLDIETILESVERTNRLLVCHEAPGRGGWAAEVAMQVSERAFDALDAPIARVCGANVPVPYSASLEPVVVPAAEQVAAGVRALLGGEVVPAPR